MKSNLSRDQVGGYGVGGKLARLARWAKAAIADARERHALRQELADCATNSDFDTILAEAGLTRGEVERLIKGHPESTRLLRAMSERLGIAGEYRKDPTIQRDMQRTCLLCVEHKRCRHWLQTERKEGYRDFCPNAELLDFLRRRVAARAAVAG